MVVVPLVLVLVLFATQTLLRLHTRTTVEALAQEAARSVALDPAAGPALRTADRRLRRALGSSAAVAEIDWTTGPTRVVVRVRVPTPRLLGWPLAGPLAEPVSVEASARPEVWR